MPPDESRAGIFRQVGAVPALSHGPPLGFRHGLEGADGAGQGGRVFGGQVTPAPASRMISAVSPATAQRIGRPQAR